MRVDEIGGGDRAEKIDRHISVNLGRRVSKYIVEEDCDKDIPHEQRMTYLHAFELFLMSRGFSMADVREKSKEEVFKLALRAAAGNTGGSIANILANVQRKALLRSYRKAEPTWKRWCKPGNLPDFKPGSRLRLSDLGDLKETNENGEILDSQMNDTKEVIQLAYFARRVSFTWQTFINDDLDALGTMPAKMGQAAARLPSRLLYANLLSNPTMGQDSTALFHVNHGNLDSNAVALSAVTLQTALSDFRKQTSLQAPNDNKDANVSSDAGIGAEPLEINPRFLMIPPELEVAAKKLIFSPGDTTANSSAGVVNVYRDILRDVIIEPRLSSSGYTGNSATAYYLIGDPDEIDTYEVAFLDGDEEPRIDSWEDFERLAVQTRCILPCGVKALDFRGIHKSVGA